jgi:glycosyltransferase involved in cell wall biosynthesis
VSCVSNPTFAAVDLPALLPASVRVAVICDFAEENWPSMDLVGDMLSYSLRQQPGMQVQQLRPALPLARETYGRTLRVFGRFVHYPRRLHQIRDHFDVFHIVDHSYAHLVHSLPPKRTIVTCHDLDTFRCLLAPQSERRSFLFRAMTRRILSGLQKAAHVTCDTAATQRELLAHTLLAPQKVSIVHNGVHPDLGAEPDPVADAEVSRIVGRHAGEIPELLHVGSTIPRKRIDVLLHVFAESLCHIPELRLLRVGGALTAEQQNLAVSLGIAGRIQTLPRLSPRLLSAVYRRAGVLLQTSESEGFGLPVIEALSCGTPVIASDIPALREIGGGHATFCPVADVQTWTHAVLEKLRSTPDKLRLIQHAERFNWSNYAAAMIDIYRRVLNGQVLSR